MPGLAEDFAATLGWCICPRNVIVEGTSDVALMKLAAELYRERHNLTILGDELAILPAGKGDDGGVDGLNRRLNAARQIADSDRGPDGSLRHRFIGLYDNDHAGRRAVSNACGFDPRLRRCRDLFLLQPIMPLASGADYNVLQQRFEQRNSAFKRLDWEVEDLISENLLSIFVRTQPSAILRTQECNGRKHREFSRDGKRLLRKFAREHARLEDLLEVVKVIRALRDYLGLRANHITC